MLLPSNKSSMFRGGFGNIFKKLNCVNRLSKLCKTCLIKNTCAYSYIFETTDGLEVPRPYVIEVPFNDKRGYKKGEVISFNLVLIGKAIQYIPHFIFTFIELGKTSGLTKNRYKFEVSQVTDSNKNIIFNGKEIISKGDILNAQDIIDNFTPPPSSQKQITLNFTAPLRINIKNKFIDKLTFEIFIKSVLRRISSVLKYHCDNIDVSIDTVHTLIEKSKNISVAFDGLKWEDWIRYSNRQHTQMLFGGLIGEIKFVGDLKEFMPYIIAGSYLHIGKNCTFGQGKYNIL